MEIEIVNSINEGLYLTLMMIKVVMVIFIFFSIAGFVIYLAGIAWFCFEEKRRSTTAPRTPRLASPSNNWRSAQLVPGTQVHMSFVNKSRADALGIANLRVSTKVASTPPA
jgi:hypothetical protein